MTYTIVGVTGHIDHGKSTLVRALTGVDTDTHPEEKRRGITIDLGFAVLREAEHRFAFIDAPGHQRYIGNLLAGVSAVDIGLLVVACDQGIQPQTLEHAAVLQTLGIRQLIVAISRIDLASRVLLAELTEELRIFLGDLGFDAIPIVAYSATTGEGVVELRQLLCNVADSFTSRDWDTLQTAAFRMPIDRVFRSPGRGLIVAGTLWSGQVGVGDLIEVAGTQEVLRVRQIEVHGESVNASVAGYRTAINLANSANITLRRGDELVAPGTHAKRDRLVVALQLFADAKAIRCPAMVQMHSATLSCEARILGSPRLLPGTEAIVVVEPVTPIVATYQQACLFRRPYPIGSLGGGRILAAVSSPSISTRHLIEFGDRLKNATAPTRLQAWIDLLGELDLNPIQDDHRCSYELGMTREQLTAVVPMLLQEQSTRLMGNRLVSSARGHRIRLAILKSLEQRARRSDSAWVDQASVVEQLRQAGSRELIAWTIDQLLAEKVIVRSNKLIAIATPQTTLSRKQRESMEAIVRLFANSRTPPTLKEVTQQFQLSDEAASSLLRFAALQGRLVDVGHGYHISKPVLITLCQELQAMFGKSSALSVAAIRDEWQVTRKHAIPLLEYCDRHQLTIRQGDLRVAGPALSELEQQLEQV